MVELNFDQINNVCQQVVEYCQSYDEFTALTMQTMYMLGCREGEASNLDRWQINDDGTILLRTIKRGGFRILTQKELPQNFIPLIAYYQERGFVKSTRQLRSTFNKFSPYQKIYTLDKEISCHLFRHNKVKQMSKDGFDQLYIMNYLAVGSTDVVNYYFNSVIYIN